MKKNQESQQLQRWEYVKSILKDDGGTLGKAFAGHAYRASADECAAAGDHAKAAMFAEKAADYDNPLTDWIALVIAEMKAKHARRARRSQGDLFD